MAEPVREQLWGYTHSIQMLRRTMEGRMFPLTLEGLRGRCGRSGGEGSTLALLVPRLVSAFIG